MSETCVHRQYALMVDDPCQCIEQPDHTCSAMNFILLACVTHPSRTRIGICAIPRGVRDLETQSALRCHTAHQNEHVVHICSVRDRCVDRDVLLGRVSVDSVATTTRC